ncbi:DUF6415 family natural product biosynthesis protein [Streptomyces sp. NPDC003038]|uniref:DUF6415 family natural product biosynthesis protein n=1 Tax=unclassified Streptomyces TaxID=2593676 RepID=UPI0033BBE1BF
MASTRADLDMGTALVRRALVPYNQKPDEAEIDTLVGDLMRHGEFLLADVAPLDEAAAALGDWAALVRDGPEDTALGTWNHARALARTVRSLHRALHHASSQ